MKLSPLIILTAVLALSLATVEATTVKYRTTDGTRNNRDHPTWGSTDVQLLRAGPSAYGDGSSSPAGADRLSARQISNVVVAQPGPTPDPDQESDMFWLWGQFIDHDITLTGTGNEQFNIPVPAGDPVFDPNGTGTVELPMNRSLYDPATGLCDKKPRQQINQITAYLDGSAVYGSNAFRAAWLREGQGGLMKVYNDPTYGQLLPFNDGSMSNAGGTGSELFVGGDVRANENVALTSMHTLFVREHNRLAGELATANPGWSDEQIFQQSRKVVGAQIQKITYNDFLPLLLGSLAMEPYEGYDKEVNSGIYNSFSTAAYRFGHSAIGSDLWRLDANGNEIPEGHLNLIQAFFNPSAITGEGGIEPLLRGLTAHQMQKIDEMIVDELRNGLFGNFDLASLNIQRGRDHGLPDYNTLREYFGLEKVTSFEEINADPNVYEALAAVYGSVDDIDAWVGGLAESDKNGAQVGPLRYHIIKEQFEAIRDGDSFWYARDPALANMIDWIERRSLADIIEDNTLITGLHDNVFLIANHAPEPAAMAMLTFGAVLLLRKKRG